MKKQLQDTLCVGFKWTLLLGVIYPLAMTLVAQISMPHTANGSQIIINNQVRGSQLLGQAFTDVRYFWGRPSACRYSAVDSTGSNLALTSALLARQVKERKQQFTNSSVPTSLLYASASGLDPHLPLSAVLFQYERVAKARSFTPQEKYALLEKIQELKQSSFFSGNDEPYINVLELNRSTDRIRP